jgi:hypothetical protein
LQSHFGLHSEKNKKLLDLGGKMSTIEERAFQRKERDKLLKEARQAARGGLTNRAVMLLMRAEKHGGLTWRQVQYIGELLHDKKPSVKANEFVKSFLKIDCTNKKETE